MTTFDALSGIANACQATPTMVTGGQPTAEQAAIHGKTDGLQQGGAEREPGREVGGAADAVAGDEPRTLLRQLLQLE